MDEKYFHVFTMKDGHVFLDETEIKGIEGLKLSVGSSTDELVNILQEKFEIKTELDELNSLIPAICPSLGMTFKAIFLRNDSNRTRPYAYLVNLW